MPAAIAGGLLRVLVVLSLTNLKEETRGARGPAPSAGQATVLEPSRVTDAANHDAEGAGLFRNFDLREAPGSGVYAWPCGLLVLFGIVLVYSIPTLRRPLSDRNSHDRAARRVETYGETGRRTISRPEQPRPLSLGKAN